MNLYAYVGNNPVNFTDPTGLLAKEAGQMVSQFSDGAAYHLDQSWGAIKNESFVDGIQRMLQGLNPAGAMAVGGAVSKLGSVAGKLDDAFAAATNWKSVKQFGHAFSEHGAGAKSAGRLLDRARGTGTPPGQWLNNEKAAQILNFAKVDGRATIRISQGLRQVIKPNGTVVSTEWARVVPLGDGLRTAFPVIGP